MFGALTNSFENLDEETRTALARLLASRNEYMSLALKYNELRIKALLNPSPATEQAASDYAAAVMAPVRLRVQKQSKALLKKAVDLDKLKELLPMLLMAVTQAVDIRLLLVALDIEPDMIDKIIELATNYFRKGM